MSNMSDQISENPFEIPELVQAVISHVNEPADLVKCACLNKLWNIETLRKLYKGSLNDMKLRTPDIGSLNCLLVASPARFATAMSLVDHLMIYPERPSQDYNPSDYEMDDSGRIICSERCRAFLDRKRSEAFLRPNGKGPKSIAIPFQIVGQNLSHVSDLLFHSHLKSLTIDDAYCELLLSELERLSKRSGLSLLDLRALSVYYSSRTLNFDALYGVLRLLDLELLHLSYASMDYDRNKPSARNILCHLESHHNLKAVALFTIWLVWDDWEFLKQADRVSFPRLRALYLSEAYPGMQKLIADSSLLQILDIRRWKSRPSEWTAPSPGSQVYITELTQIIQRLPDLKIIDVVIDTPWGVHNTQINGSQFLLDISNSCHFLRKLKVETNPKILQLEVSEEEFSMILKCLPHIQWLAFNFKIRLSGLKLRNLAEQCPSLTFLELENGILFLSDKHLTNTPPLWQLQHMNMKHVWFENPRDFWTYSKLESLAIKWKKFFPQLIELPCRRDLALMMEETVMEDIYEEDQDSRDAEFASETKSDTHSSSADNKTPYPEPDSTDITSDWYVLRLRLWLVLGYGKNYARSLQKAKHMWQTNFEIETFGWPIMPLQAFRDPVVHSSSSKTSS